MLGLSRKAGESIMIGKAKVKVIDIYHGTCRIGTIEGKGVSNAMYRPGDVITLLADGNRTATVRIKAISNKVDMSIEAARDIRIDRCENLASEPYLSAMPSTPRAKRSMEAHVGV